MFFRRIDTIITSFPQNWTHDDEHHITNKDPMDVLKSIHRYLTLVNRPPLESVHDLAQLIVYKSLATFCRKSTPYGPMQILDVYESAIASVVFYRFPIILHCMLICVRRTRKLGYSTNSQRDRRINGQVNRLQQILGTLQRRCTASTQKFNN